MVFSSPTFLYAFLPIFLISYFLVREIAWRNGVLLAFSLAFYAWGEPVFVLVMLASIVVNWAAARAMSAARTRKRTVLSVGIVLNLGLLGVAKYADFIVITMNGVIPSLSLPQPNLPLPLGVSFFTFQAMSYLIDVYREEAPVERSLARVALYISMFPQLVAGPIVRFSTVAAQIGRRRSTVWRGAAGTRIFAIGLAQKVLIANEAGLAADVAFSLGPNLDPSEAWAGLAAYTLQIYYDFAGYSNMAIGLGLILGFSFPRNFNLPYTACSVTEFWRRWHISLSTWFRDYLYIPLGGNRHGPFRTYFNLSVVFLLCGAWHGASWNFIAWGAWHGALLIAERAGGATALSRVPHLVSRAYLLLAVMAGWVLFRAETLADAGVYYRALLGQMGDGLFNADLGSVFTPYRMAVFVVGVLLALVRLRAPRMGAASHPQPVGSGRSAAVARLGSDVVVWAFFVLSLIAIAGAGNNPFLYFRF